MPDTRRLHAFPDDVAPSGPSSHRSRLRAVPAPVSQFNQLSTRDRIAALSWADQAGIHGYTKVVFDTARENSGHEPGDFLLIYPQGEVWARWGIGCGPAGLTLWHAGSGATLGTYATMGETLAALPIVQRPD